MQTNECITSVTTRKSESATNIVYNAAAHCLCAVKSATKTFHPPISNAEGQLRFNYNWVPEGLEHGWKTNYGPPRGWHVLWSICHLIINFFL